MQINFNTQVSIQLETHILPMPKCSGLPFLVKKGRVPPIGRYTACNLPCALTPPVFLHLPCVQSDVLIPIASRHATNTLLYHAQFLLFRDGEQCVLWNRWLTKRPKRHDVLIQNLLCMKYYHKRTFYSFFIYFFQFLHFPINRQIQYHSNL